MYLAGRTPPGQRRFRQLSLHPPQRQEDRRDRHHHAAPAPGRPRGSRAGERRLGGGLDPRHRDAGATTSSATTPRMSITAGPAKFCTKAARVAPSSRRRGACRAHWSSPPSTSRRRCRQTAISCAATGCAAMPPRLTASTTSSPAGTPPPACRTAADYSVGTVWGAKGLDFYLLDCVRGRFEAPQLRQQILASRSATGSIRRSLKIPNLAAPSPRICAAQITSSCSAGPSTTNRPAFSPSRPASKPARCTCPGCALARRVADRTAGLPQWPS